MLSWPANAIEDRSAQRNSRATEMSSSQFGGRLTDAEAERCLKLEGLNELPGGESRTPFQILAEMTWPTPGSLVR